MQIDTNGFELGDVVRDRISGAEGVITGIHQWLTGCARVSIQAKVGDNGKVPETVGSDVLTIEHVEGAEPFRIARVDSIGGPAPEPARFAEPAR